MKTKTNQPRFTIRRISNRNPQNPRRFHWIRQRLWRLALVALITIVGIGGLLLLGNLQNQKIASLDSVKAENLRSKLTIKNNTVSPDFKDTTFLGDGFKSITNFSDKSSNKALSTRGSDYQQAGVKNINALLYNVKDYFKYVAGGIAFLFFIIAATQLVTATGDEQIKKGKDNLQWCVVALLAIFVIDLIVVAFYEGGSYSGNSAGESLFTIDNSYDVTTTETNLMRNIAGYFQKDAREIFSYIKTLGAAFAILFIFMAGAHMISAGGNEENIEKEKKYLMHAITAFVVLIMVDSFIFDFIYPSETFKKDDKGLITEIGLTAPECVEYLDYVSYDKITGFNFGKLNGSETQIAQKKDPSFIEKLKRCIKKAQALSESGKEYTLGIVNFFQSLLGGIAIFFIVSSGVQIIGSMGDEERLTKHKKQIAWSLAGLAVVVLSKNLVMKFFFVADSASGNVHIDNAQGIADLVGVTNFLSTFVGVFATVSILIAGIIWVANFGNTEIAEKAKKVVFGAIVGVILSISAYAIVNSITSGNPDPSNGGIQVDTNGQSFGISNDGINVSL